MKRYAIGNERISETMFDFAVSAALASMTSTRHPDRYVTTFEVARHMYARPNTTTFRNVGAALARLHVADPTRIKRDRVSMLDSYSWRFEPLAEDLAFTRRTR